MNTKIKVKYIGKGEKGFVNGNIYDGYRIQGAVPNKDTMISVIDQFGEEYAFPENWFEIVKE